MDKREAPKKPLDVTTDTGSDRSSAATDSEATLLRPDLQAGVAPVSAVRRFGRFSVVRVLGQGGMGTVYEVHDMQSGRSLALKTLRLDTGATWTRFFSEFHVLAGLRHPNVVRIYELGMEEGVPFFTMELLSGVPFNQWVGFPGENGLDAQQLLRLREALRQLVDALVYLHSAGVLHRDLKPSNVFVLPDGTVKVLDLGLAVPLSDRGTYQPSLPGAIIGTLAYMAPEQAEGEELTPATDWYSVGVLLYECLAGHRPFQATSWEELLRLKKQPPPRLPATCAPAELITLVGRLMDPDPSMRPDGKAIAVALSFGGRIHTVVRDELVGRQVEQQRLRDILERTVAASATCVTCVSGPSGMGKSELARWLYHQLQQDGRVQAYLGKCYETVLLPYKAWSSIHLGLARSLLALGRIERQAVAPLDVDLLCETWPVFHEVFLARSVERRLSAQDRRRRAFAALRELLWRVGPRGPLGRALPVFIVDELQWADLDSVWLLRDLLQHDPPPMWMLWLVRQEDEINSPALRMLLPQVQSLAASGRLAFHRVHLGPLEPRAARALVQRRLGPLATRDELVHQIVAESSGNPLLLCQLSAYAVQKCSRPSEIAFEGHAGKLTVERVVAELVGDLPSNARMLLESVACAARPIAQSLVTQSIGLKHSDDQLWDDLVRHSLVRLVGTDPEPIWDCYHDRVRAAIVDRLDPQSRRNVHARLAAILAEQPEPDAEFVAQQYVAADRPADAAAYLLQAARSAGETLAFDRATRLYRMALDCPLSDSQKPVALVAYAQALANLGRCRQAADVFLEASGCVPADQAQTYMCQAAWNYLASGHTSDGLRLLRDVLKNSGLSLPSNAVTAAMELAHWSIRLALPSLRQPGPSSPKLIRQLDACWSAVAGLSLIDPLRAAALTSRLLWLSRRSDSPRHHLRALGVYIGHRMIGGTTVQRRGERLLAELRNLALRYPSTYADAVVALTEGVVAHLQGDWQQAWSRCDQAVEWFSVAEYPDVAWEMDTAQTVSMWARLYGGRFHELMLHQPAARQAALERDDLFARWNAGARVLAMLGLANDEPDAVWQDLEEDERLLPSDCFYVQHHNLLLARVMCQLYEGRAIEAWQRIANAWNRYRNALLSRVQQVRIDFWKMYGLAALSAGVALRTHEQSRDQPVSHCSIGWFELEVQRSMRRLRAEHARWASALAELFDACLASFHGPAHSVAHRFAAAATALDQVSMSLFAEAARWRSWQWQQVVSSADQSALKSPAGIRNWSRWLNWLAPSVCPQ